MAFRAKLLLLIAAEGAALGAVARVRTSDPIRWRHVGAWVGEVTPETALIEVGRVVALGLATWLLATTALTVAVHLTIAMTGRATCLAPLAALAPRFVMTVVERAVTVTVVAGTLAANPVVAGASPMRAPVPPIATHEPVAPLAPVRDGRTPTKSTEVLTGPPFVSAPSIPASATPAPPPAPPLPPVTSPAVDEMQPGPSAERVVAAGESLWSIASDVVRSAGGTSEEVTRYWRELCEWNRASLRSGDVNLVYPGERIALPPR